MAGAPLKFAKAIREATQTARRILDADSRDLLRLAWPYHWSDEVRAPREKRASSESTVRLLPRGSSSSPGPADYWPAEKAASREAPVEELSEPQD